MLAEGPWADRSLYLTASFGGKLWIMGGQGNAPNLKDWEAAGGAELTDGRNGGSAEDDAPPLRDVWASANGRDWQQVTDSAPWAPRGMTTGANGGVAVHAGKMWILGGGFVGPGGTAAHTRKYSLSDQPRMAARKFLNDVWSSSNGRDWELVCADPPWIGRSNHVRVHSSSRQQHPPPRPPPTSHPPHRCHHPSGPTRMYRPTVLPALPLLPLPAGRRRLER